MNYVAKRVWLRHDGRTLIMKFDVPEGATHYYLNYLIQYNASLSWWKIVDGVLAQWCSTQGWVIKETLWKEEHLTPIEIFY